MRHRRHREDHVSHERWLVSYADFITLLFAFFVVMFASAYRDSQAVLRVSNAIHHGFQSLGAFSGDRNEQNLAYESPSASLAPERGASNGNDVAALATSHPDLLKLKKELEAAMGDELKHHEVALRVTPEGFVISLQELGFFDSGQAVLLPGAATKIQRIAGILGAHGLDLRVEGHSDNQPIHNAQFRSNWELSTARAMSVLMYLVDDCGYDPKKLSVAGYAQYRPVGDDSTPDGRRKNRRVDLVVVQAASPQPGVP